MRWKTIRIIGAIISIIHVQDVTSEHGTLSVTEEYTTNTTPSDEAVTTESEERSSNENVPSTIKPNTNTQTVEIIPDITLETTSSVFESTSTTEINNSYMSIEETENLMVQTTHGRVRGFKWKGIENINAFIDIPYGQINKPFQAANTAQSWLDVHYVTEHTKMCPQLKDGSFVGDISCLSLSIFTPNNVENASVLVQLHDVNSNKSSADPNVYGPEYLVARGLILVLPNYRVGPLGFMCLQNEIAPGNAGLKDLSLALEWVKENIEFFGGNPYNIAVSGDGDAGAIASYLALYAPSKYYISRIITESGSALSHWALDRDPIYLANELATRITSNSVSALLYNNIFEEANVSTIIEAADGMKFNPCVEGDNDPFIDEPPWRKLHEKINTTFMIGSARYAGAHDAFNVAESTILEMNTDFSRALPNDLHFDSEDEKDKYARALRQQYFGDRNISNSDIEELALWYTDASYLSPSIRLARPLVRAGATVYFYEFEYTGQLNIELYSMNRPVQGAVRSDIIGYLFYQQGTEAAEVSTEEHVINVIVDLWASFINIGTPTSYGVVWRELCAADDTEEQWLQITSQPAQRHGIYVDRLRVWTSLYDGHYIDRNLALRRKPHYLALPALLMLWIANAKLNYGRD